jgi:AraC-like DNA-binding protein
MLERFPSLSWFFLFAFSVNGLVAIAILLLKNKTLRTANFLLAINLMGISFISISLSLVLSRLILEIPHFYRLPSPLYYLMFPAAYLYVKLLINDRTRLERKEYLHFTPALIHLIEMMPFYLQSTEAKMNHLTRVFNQNIEFYAHNEGWLPPYLHNIIRGGLAIIYAIAMWSLIRKSFQDKPIVSAYSQTVIRWLKTFTLLNAVIGIGTVLLLSFINISPEIRSMALHILFLIVLLIVNFYLFWRPEILYGLPQPVALKIAKPGSSEILLTPENDPLSSSAPIDEIKEIPSFVYQYKNQVHQYLVESQRYREPEFNLLDLSRDTCIPKHHLQLLIHKAEGKKFTEFINDYRIHHLKSQIEKGALKNKTLEGLATESGFSSKATFIRSVKKLTGKTPKEYFIND